MTALQISLVTFALVFGGGLFGMYLRHSLSENHLREDVKDVIKLSTSLIGTMAALVLGLLIASAKNTYDTKSSQVRQITANIILIDLDLEQYGPPALDLRKVLRGATPAFVDRIWNEGGGGKIFRFVAETESAEFSRKVRQLQPNNDLERALQTQVQSAAGNLAQARLSLFTEAHDRMPAPFLVTLILWFAIIFTSFGLFVRHSRIAIIAIFIAGMSVSSAIGTATPDDAYAAAKLAWVADHPGHSADDYDIWGGLRATPEQQQHWLDWTAAFLAKRDDPDVLSRGLAEARAEIEQLREQLTAKAAPAADRDLHSKYFAALRETDRLRAQLAAIDKLESEQVRALRQRIAELEQRLARRRDNAAGAAQTGAALDPHSAAAIEIERLKTWVQNLRRELALWKERDREAGKRGVPSFQVESLFAKALATEHEPTKQARTEAWKAYTAWKADAKKPAR